MTNLENQKENVNPDDFYASLKEKLEATHDFPEDYLFKFIITNQESKHTEIYRVFDDIKFTLNTRESKNGKYTSISMNDWSRSKPTSVSAVLRRSPTQILAEPPATK